MTNKICENCNIEHNGSYASGRFCCKKCAKAFATKFNRLETNKKVSLTLTGRHYTFRPRVGRPRSKESLEKQKLTLKRKRFGKNSDSELRTLIFNKQNGKCLNCGTEKWNDKTLRLHLDHVNGNKNDNSPNNLRFLCPNCHSLTHTFGSRNIESRRNVSEAITEKRYKQWSMWLEKRYDAILNRDFVDLSYYDKKIRIFTEQNSLCAICAINGELRSPTFFRLDHTNGNNTDNSRTNLRIICHNCDSQLLTYCYRNKKK